MEQYTTYRAKGKDLGLTFFFAYDLNGNLKAFKIEKGKLKKGDPFIHESIIGSKFTGSIEEELMLDRFPAIRPSITGWAKIYGYNTISIDRDDDPYAYGFQVL